MSLNLNPPDPIDSSDVVLPPVVDLHPWRRYFARRLDYVLFGLLAGVILSLMGDFPEDENRSTDLLTDIILIVSWIPIEAALLAYGTTPGKWLFGIEVRTASGQRLNYAQAFRRSFWVCGVGVGFGIPLLSLIGCWRASKVLEDTGTTSWDEPEGHVVTHRGFQWWHLVAAVFLLLLVMALLYVNGMLLMPFLKSLRPGGGGVSNEG